MIPTLVISCGDPHSINLEILAKCQRPKGVRFIIVGSKYHFNHQNNLNSQKINIDHFQTSTEPLSGNVGTIFVDVDETEDHSLTQKYCGDMSIKSLEVAARYCQNHGWPLVTLPVNKYLSLIHI